eukprot:4262402-Amphidinium_carterae.1
MRLVRGANPQARCRQQSKERSAPVSLRVSPRSAIQLEVDDIVQEDMKQQERWVMALQPRWAMLKFRLPWSAGCTEYLDGDIHLPVWGPQTTTETRLITNGCKKRS